MKILIRLFFYTVLTLITNLLLLVILGFCVGFTLVLFNGFGSPPMIFYVVLLALCSIYLFSFIYSTYKISTNALKNTPQEYLLPIYVSINVGLNLLLLIANIAAATQQYL